MKKRRIIKQAVRMDIWLTLEHDMHYYTLEEIGEKVTEAIETELSWIGAKAKVGKVRKQRKVTAADKGE